MAASYFIALEQSLLFSACAHDSMKRVQWFTTPPSHDSFKFVAVHPANFTHCWNMYHDSPRPLPMLPAPPSYPALPPTNPWKSGSLGGLRDVGYVWGLQGCRVHLETSGMSGMFGGLGHVGNIWSPQGCRVHLESSGMSGTFGGLRDVLSLGGLSEVDCPAVPFSTLSGCRTM